MKREDRAKRKVLMVASVASMIDQFNMPNIQLLLDMGYEVHVACNFQEGSTCDAKRIRKFQKLLEEMHIIWHQWDCPRNPDSLTKCSKAYMQLLRLLDRYHYKWLHCHSPVGGALARLAAHRRGMKVIYTAHGFHFYRGAPLKNWVFYYSAEKLLSYWTDVLITVNKEDFQFAKRNLKAKQIRWIPGVGIDVSCFRDYQPKMTKEEFRKKHDLPENAKILLSVGELSKRKNHQLVLFALPALEEDIVYMVCGQGELQGTLLDLVQELGVEDRVRLLGYVEDLREIYKNTDIFVFPSFQEGLPTALAEAMASGLPCLVSDIRGSRELVRQKNSRFQPDSEQYFLRHLISLLDDPRLLEQNVKQGQKQVERYDLKKAKTRMRKIYKDMEY